MYGKVCSGQDAQRKSHKNDDIEVRLEGWASHHQEKNIFSIVYMINQNLLVIKELPKSSLSNMVATCEYWVGYSELRHALSIKYPHDFRLNFYKWKIC